MTETRGRPKVSICLPTIGRLKYMDETLQSLKAQTLGDYELLVLYNGSDAEVHSRLEEFVREHRDGRVLADPTPMPMFANFNRGLREARGEYVAFFHDDDTYDSSFLARLTEMLDANPRAAFAGSNYWIIDSKSQVQGHRRLLKVTEIQPGETFICDLIRRGRAVIPTPGILFRRSVFGPEGWDERLSMHFGDYVVLMRMAERYDAALISEPLMSLRLHGTNASNVPMSSAGPLQYQIISSYVDEYAERHPGMPINGKLAAYARATYVRHLCWGWVSAENDTEAGRCVQLLNDAGVRMLPGILKFLREIGLGARHRRTLTAFLRRLGRRIG